MLFRSLQLHAMKNSFPPECCLCVCGTPPPTPPPSRKLVFPLLPHTASPGPILAGRGALRPVLPQGSSRAQSQAPVSSVWTCPPPGCRPHTASRAGWVHPRDGGSRLRPPVGVPAVIGGPSQAPATPPGRESWGTWAVPPSRLSVLSPGCAKGGVPRPQQEPGGQAAAAPPRPGAGSGCFSALPGELRSPRQCGLSAFQIGRAHV